ncbi:hypothetical protein ZORO111903_14495 [Zobellia roscoffensis]
MKFDVYGLMIQESIFATKRVNWPFGIENCTFVHYFYTLNKQIALWHPIEI